MSLSFPTSPTTGQIYQNWQWSGSAWLAVPQGIAPVPGQRVLIQRQNVSAAVATVDFLTGLTTLYDEYELVWFGAFMTNDSYLNFRISNDGGATWRSGGSDYGLGVTIAFQAYTLSSWTGGTMNMAQICGTSVGANPWPLSGRMKFFQPAVAVGGRRFFHVESVFNNPTNGPASWNGIAEFIPDATPFNGLRLFMSNGNITAGSFLLYGTVK